jgi:hypothetical protein
MASYAVAGQPGLTLETKGNGFDTKCPNCGKEAHLRMSAPYPDDNFVNVDKVSYTCDGEKDGDHCGYSVKEGQLLGTL